MSTPSKPEFFEQATKHLLSNLDLQEGLGRLLLYLQEIMPCQEIRLATYFMQEKGSMQNLHLRATLSGTSSYYGSLLSKSRMSEMQALKGRQGELITDPNHPLVLFCNSFSDKSRPPMPLPWYELILRDKDKILGECRFSGHIEQPFSPAELALLDSLRPVLCIALSNYQKCQELENHLQSVCNENQQLKKNLNASAVLDVFHEQHGMKQVVERAGLVAMHDIPVLITGETGTGKELVASMIHELSPRSNGPFIALNCGATPPSLMDSELFGHVKGAFTGAMRDHKGYFERAAGGTLLLDEVGEIPIDMQARLLRVLQEQEVVPVGGSTPRRVDSRIIAATNQNLPEMVKKGSFRADLYFRLHVAHIHLPPLRERIGDLPVLVHRTLEKLSKRFRTPPMRLAAGELEKLYAYNWPGNIRELQNVLMEAMAISPSYEQLRLATEFPPVDAPRRGQSVARHQAESSAQEPGQGHTPLPAQVDESLRSSEVMAAHYAKVLAACGGRIKGERGAAALLGLNPSTLRFRLKKLGLVPEKSRQ